MGVKKAVLALLKLWLKMTVQNTFTELRHCKICSYKRRRARPKVNKVQPNGSQIQNCQATLYARQGHFVIQYVFLMVHKHIL